MVKNVSLRDTKNTIFSAYKQLNELKKQLEQQLKNKDREVVRLQKELTAKPEVTVARTTAPTPSVKPKKAISSTGQANTIQQLLDYFDTIERNIGVALSNNANKQAIEAEKLGDLQKSIESTKTDIEELYDIKIGDNSLDDIIENYRKEKESFEKQHEEQNKKYDEEYRTKKEEWDKDHQDYNEGTSERDFEARLNHERDVEAFQYQLLQDRSLEKDNYQQKIKVLENELKEIESSKEEEWKEIEKEISEREEKRAKYKTDFEELESKLEKAIKKTEAEGKAIIEREHKVKLNLLKKEVDAQNLSDKISIESLENTANKQSEQMIKLGKQLNNAHTQVQSLALKALEGSQNSDSFNAIREIAMEQAKTASKGK
jgi:hypothetical protein